MRTANAADGKRLKGETWVKMKKYRFLYALILPAFVLTLIFCYLPMLGVVIAFQDYDIIDGIFGSRFVWFDNFIKIFTYPKFLYAIKNTVFYSAVISAQRRSRFCWRFCLTSLETDILKKWFRQSVIFRTFFHGYRLLVCFTHFFPRKERLTISELCLWAPIRRG